MKIRSITTILYGNRPLIAVGCTVLLLFALYVYLVSMSVVHVVIQKEIRQDINTINSEISRLEADYIAAQHAVSERIARLDGYTEVGDKIYIDRTSDTLVLSIEATP